MYIVDNKAKCHNRFIRCAHVKNSDLFAKLGFSRPLGDSLPDSNYSRNPIEIGENNLSRFDQYLYDDYVRSQQKESEKSETLEAPSETDV